LLRALASFAASVPERKATVSQVVLDDRAAGAPFGF